MNPTTSIQSRSNCINFLLIALVLMNTVTTEAQTYAVMNATSSSGANGIYLEDGTYSGYPKYTNGSYTLFHTPDQFMKWAILPNGRNLGQNDYANSEYCYSTKIDGDTPPHRAWHHGGNTTGLPGEYIIVIQQNSLGYSLHYFIESTVNDGSIMDSSLVFLFAEGVSLSGSDYDDFIADGKASVTNLPSGLTASLVKQSDSTLYLILHGNADHHSMNDNTEIQLNIENAAFTNNDASVISFSNFTFGILFQTSYHIEGANANPNANGEYKLTGMYNEYPWFIHNNYYLTTKSCNPKWIIRSESVVHPLYSTQIETEFPKNREWHRGGFFYTMGDPLQVGMVNSILYEKYSFVESETEEGTFPDSLKIRYYHPNEGSAFSGEVNEDLFGEGKVLVSNIPAGLSAIVRKHNDTTLYINLAGKSDKHEVVDNITNLMIEYTPEAFTDDGIYATNNNAIDSLNIIYMQKYVLVDTTFFSRGVNGIYSAYDIINHCTAYSSNNEYFLVFRNTPPNCVWGVLKAGAQNAYFSSGIASDYPPPNNWVNGDWNGTTQANIEIFPLQPWLSYHDLEIEEAEENPGIIIDTIRIYLNNNEEIEFSGNNQEDFIQESKAEVINLPEGLQAEIIKISGTELRMIVSGTAVKHDPADDVRNLTIHIKDEAFNGSPELVKFKSIYSIKVKFNSYTDLAANSNKCAKEIVFPNPASDYIRVNIKILNGEVYDYSIYNLLGRLVSEGKQKHDVIDVSKLSAGLYLVSISCNKKNVTDRIVIQ